jgi:Zn ribbon nucleic-acid-binding protein
MEERCPHCGDKLVGNVTQDNITIVKCVNCTYSKYASINDKQSTPPVIEEVEYPKGKILLG